MSKTDVEMQGVKPSPAEITPHRDVTLKLLGEGQNCEVGNCGRPAYMVCGDCEQNKGFYPFLMCFCMGRAK